MHSRFSGVEWPMFAVDSAAFAALYILSLISTRYWPAWMAAMQGCVALSHLSGLRLDIIPWAYGTVVAGRSEEHTSELQSLMRISYAVFCLKKKKTNQHTAPNK